MRDRYLEENSGHSAFESAAVNADGRPTDTLALDSTTGSVNSLYEKNRVSRTVALDPSKGAKGRWTVLTASRSQGTTYFDWDADYYYLAYESLTPQDVRFDLDGQGDGWLRGADNIAVQFLTERSVFNEGRDRMTALRLNAARDRDNARWERLPVPARELKAYSGRMDSPPYLYVVMVGIPRSDAIDLKTNARSMVGIRIETGSFEPLSLTSPITTRLPFLKTNLVESAEAQADNLQVRLNLKGQKERQSGETVKAQLEIKNNRKEAVRPQRLYVQGYLSSREAVGEQDFSGEEIKPGQTLRRDVELAVKPAAPVGAVGLVGGVELRTGERVAALTSFERVDFASLVVNTDGKSVKNGKTVRKEIEVVIRYWRRDPAYGDLTLHLPEGWYTDGDPNRRIALTYPTLRKSVKYKIIVPNLAEPGIYRFDAEIIVNGRHFIDSGNIRVERP